MNSSSIARVSGRSICSSCLTHQQSSHISTTLLRSSLHTKRKLHGTIVPDERVQKNMVIQSQPSFHDYFSANTSIDRGWLKNGVLAAFRTAAESPKKPGPVDQVLPEQQEQIQPADSTGEQVSHTLAKQEEGGAASATSVIATGRLNQDDLLPHRRRKLARSMSNTAGAPAINQVPSTQEEQLPLDASSQLTTAATSLPASATARRRFATYLSLTKPRLSFLIILTTSSAYSLYPIPDILSETATHAAVNAASTLSTSTLTFTFLTLGTFLCSASANTFNMLFEPKYDALMSRTRNRPLVRKLISPRAASIFAVSCAATGIGLLYLGTNPTVAALGALNIFLYAGVYTPMKRLSPVNTWVGAIVGGIPPLMGWCAAAGEVATSEHHSWRDLLLSSDAVGGWLLAGLLFAWQFPHFNSLSHTIREDYRAAGHKMLAWMNPARNARVALRYSVLMFPVCAGLYWAGVVNPGFLVISTACNTWMLKEAVRFYRNQGGGGSARGLFWASVWQLPLVLVGALVCKTGIWDGVFEGEKEETIDIHDEDEETVDDIEAHGQATMVRTSI